MFGSWLAQFFTAALAWLAGYFGKRAALAIAVVAVFVSMLVALWALIHGLVTGLVYVTPKGGVFDGFWMGFFLVMPSNWQVCASACLSADVAVFLYRFNVTRIATPTVGV
ncbi:DUF5455 family protein [Uliginosibacterium sp. H3]|uniref:DUF5455 family protein n=1 Tax=Uliginosibacterium silvisoli TaxID=3114758 RepID=A0ABU6K497_9RHOO|nr:DUF5455 family protein [Uliginosibacterium sp. H3]